MYLQDTKSLFLAVLFSSLLTVCIHDIFSIFTARRGLSNGKGSFSVRIFFNSSFMADYRDRAASATSHE